jgi:metal-responsive CopG/Arc/MetJ family transcriptional regulator
MGAISLRLPEQLERKLGLEARLSGQPRSQLLREALEDLLSRRERERSVAELVAAAKALVADPEAIEESLALANDFSVAESEALAQAEASASTTGLGDGATAWWR